MKRTSHSYFVVMEDLGQRGLEAVVTPETTRRAVVEFIKNGNYRNIVFIHHVDGLFIEDVTSELIDAAELELKEAYLAKAMRELNTIDHAQDLRKNWEPV
jgi:hypothetical protein